MLTFDQIKELIELVADHRLEEVSIERSGFKIEIVGRSVAARGVAAAPSGALTAPTEEASAAAIPQTAEAEVETPSETFAEAAGRGLPDSAAIVTSPIVGTYYSAPNPDAQSYVRVGDRVEKGQVLCIVEAMKLMNEIESEASGVIVEIYPKNAQPVEFGEPLFAIVRD